MPGPAPKPTDQRRRRNAPSANTVKLPATGRSGPPPAWPLDSEQPSFWAELWASPQAVAWERAGWIRMIARYASLVVATEQESCPALIFGEVRQMEDRLGLSPMSLLRLRWEIEEVEAPAVEAVPVAAGPKRRLTVA